ncbi:hypothetical protein N656DRAFT_796911 [Canariomyces notabilis]|uniref:Uncharacterized protein n=1 Tax=Canariomyces notabilis TaxID=2074819 RepID=A0AAN6TFW1_9PEZI|nr:hypothetical protein N656DRAFT_796911 [Canariomyces arenarius]
MLYSQCHARSRLPFLSHIPLLGAPTCALVSFVHEAAATSLRGAALMADLVFSFIAGLLTVCVLEAARPAGTATPLTRHPTGTWLVFSLLIPAGALVWELVVVPGFLHRARATSHSRSNLNLPTAEASDNMKTTRHHVSPAAESLAIPVSIAIGYIIPSITLLIFAHHHPATTILPWLFFPVWVSLTRRLVRLAATSNKLKWNQAQDQDQDQHQTTAWQESMHLASSPRTLVGIYLLPIVCSVLAHGWLVVHVLRQADDRREMARAMTKFVIINVFFIGLTVLYWVLVEAGWRGAVLTAVASAVLGPGAGVCVGWIYREKVVVDSGRGSVTVVAVGSRRGSRESEGPSENTPLLR